ncbi:hypothetical protein E4U56_002879 [Claviceps arundinis]|uniref:Uncharacterized protein n=1 Tax=Claviceps arundinis TaxID=1623583 RepID=A0A9P7N2W5_9HYPO|nr:hypothetical protein E4U56_002879 [Claviceps arundinis]
MSAAEFLRSTRRCSCSGSQVQRSKGVFYIFAVPSAWNVARPPVVPPLPLVVSIATPLAPPPPLPLIGRATWNNVWGSWSGAQCGLVRLFWPSSVHTHVKCLTVARRARSSQDCQALSACQRSATIHGECDAMTGGDEFPRDGLGILGLEARDAEHGGRRHEAVPPWSNGSNGRSTVIESMI